MAKDQYGLEVEKGDENWLPCIRFEGEGYDIPAGFTGMPGIQPWKLVKAVIILDAEADEGVRRIRLSEYKPEEMDIVDVVINDASYRAALKQHPRGFTFITANAGRVSREKWREEFKTDALHLIALSQIRNLYHKKENEPFKIGDKV